MKDFKDSLGFVVEQTAAIEAEVNEATYPDILYESGVIPVDTSGHELATSVAYYSSEKHGRAEWINGNADDVPIADVTRNLHQVGVHSAAIGYAYGWEEISQAQMLGLPLSADKALAARRASAEMIDHIALFGAQAKGFDGLVNHSDVSADPLGHDWSSATAAQIIEDINSCLCHSYRSTGGTSIADTLLVPWEAWCKLGNPRSEHSDLTIMQYLTANNIYTATTGQPLTIRGVRGLKGAGEGGTDRLVAYRRSPDVLKLHLPMPHRFLDPWQSGPLRWDIPGLFRTGGLDIRRPDEVSYCDGVIVPEDSPEDSPEESPS